MFQDPQKKDTHRQSSKNFGFEVPCSHIQAGISAPLTYKDTIQNTPQGQSPIFPTIEEERLRLPAAARHLIDNVEQNILVGVMTLPPSSDAQRALLGEMPIAGNGSGLGQSQQYPMAQPLLQPVQNGMPINNGFMPPARTAPIYQPQHSSEMLGQIVLNGTGQYQGPPLPVTTPRPLELSREFFDRAFVLTVSNNHRDDESPNNPLEPWGTFIGDIYDAKVYLSKRPPAGPVPNHITHVLSAANAVSLDRPQQRRFIANNTLYSAPLSTDGDIQSRHLDEIFAVGKEISRAGGHLLVLDDHHGVSRGPAAIAMLFMKFQNWTLSRVLELFESKGIKLKFNRDVGMNLLELERKLFPGRPENILSPTGQIMGPRQYFQHHNAGIGFGHSQGYVSNQQLQSSSPQMQAFKQDAQYQNAPTAMGHPSGPKAQGYIEDAQYQNVPTATGQPQGTFHPPQQYRAQSTQTSFEPIPHLTLSPKQWQTRVRPGFLALIRQGEERLSPPEDNSQSQTLTPSHPPVPDTTQQHEILPPVKDSSAIHVQINGLRAPGQRPFLPHNINQQQDFRPSVLRPNDSVLRHQRQQLGVGIAETALSSLNWAEDTGLFGIVS
jgi:hypothetical protein